ncbi:MAG: RHS repeat-associated core domain-containing protein [Planctomycetes bacterium]|nr:RHS repeat-associated core domain-containing protein [Planctomycetota bacterium]
MVRYNPATNTTQVANHLFYDAFGNIVKESDVNLEHRFAFTGREWDEEIDLQYNRARYYDPQMGRWISKDLLGFDAGDMNLYRYVGNGPTDASDPSGLEETFFDKLRKRDEEIRYLASPHSGSLQHESSERVKEKSRQQRTSTKSLGLSAR